MVKFLLHLLLSLAAWFAALVLSPAANLAWRDKSRPTSAGQRGVSILPGWPIVPLLICLPVFFFGAGHIVSKWIGAGNIAVLLLSMSHVGWRLAQLRRHARKMEMDAM